MYGHHCRILIDRYRFESLARLAAILPEDFRVFPQSLQVMGPSYRPRPLPFHICPSIVAVEW
jgi:hypothetical protein